jgi:CHAP domain/Putative peptidoglycan binding domain
VATALDIVTTAQQQVGFVEGPNNQNPYGDWYGIPNEPYCAMGISWVFAQHDLSHLVAAQTSKGFAYCPAGLAWFQAKGAVVGKYDAKPGDLVFFSWSGNGQADHVEIVVAASRDGITTVGFNTGPENSVTHQNNGDGCYLRHRAYLYVLAICRPAYETSMKPAQSVGTNKLVATGLAGATALTGGGVAMTHNSTPATTKPTTTFVAPPFGAIKVGDKSAVATAVEKALFKAGLIPAEAVNAAYTAADAAAVKTYQKSHGLTADGILGQVTYYRMMKDLP